jgi:hypothetical protein
MPDLIIPGMLLGTRRRTAIWIACDGTLCLPIREPTANFNATIRIEPADKATLRSDGNAVVAENKLETPAHGISVSIKAQDRCTSGPR